MAGMYTDCRPGPVFFAPVIVDYLFGGISAVKPSADDVPDEELQLKN